MPQARVRPARHQAGRNRAELADGIIGGYEKATDPNGSSDGAGAVALTGPAAEPITTDRLTLEPLKVEHAEEMTAVLAGPALYTFIGGGPPTLPELQWRYRQMVAGPPGDRQVGWLNWVIRRRQDDRLTGTVQATICPEPGGGDHPLLLATVAWMVGTSWQGHGIATEAAQALIGWLRARKVTAIMATIHPGNAASAAVARRAGLVPTEDLIDDEIVWVRPAKP
jgi:RimJ/RimL family protein N-acetyltransferase